MRVQLISLKLNPILLLLIFAFYVTLVLRKFARITSIPLLLRYFLLHALFLYNLFFFPSQFLSLKVS